jgi:dihydrofolate reductase
LLREAGLKTSVFIATSLDGFIARLDDTFDWLPEAEGADKDYGFSEFAASVDALVLGRRTYEVVLGFDSWPYGSLPVYVLTSHDFGKPSGVEAQVVAMAGTPQEIAGRLQAKGHQHVWVDGGVTIQRFLRAGLIDELVLTRVPVLLGSGIPLFGELDHDLWLEHTGTRSLDEGMTQSTYRVLDGRPVGPPSGNGAGEDNS